MALTDASTGSPVDSKGQPMVQAKPQEDPGWFQPGSTSDAITRGGANGATLGLGKYVNAAVKASPLSGVADAVFEGISPSDPKQSRWEAIKSALTAPSENFSDSVNAEKAANANAADAHPVAYGASQLAGSLPSALMAGGGSLPAMLAKQAAVGATQGAANDTSGHPLTAAAVGGTLGAVTGGVGRGVAGAVNAGAKAVGRKLETDAIDNAANDTLLSDAEDVATKRAANTPWQAMLEGAKQQIQQRASNGVGGLLSAVHNAPALAKVGAIMGAVTNAGAKSLKDSLAGGSGNIVSPGVSRAAQAGTQKVQELLNSSSDGGNDYAQLLGFLNQTDPEVRAATNSENPQNKK